jgi:hypothetical protein
VWGAACGRVGGAGGPGLGGRVRPGVSGGGGVGGGGSADL